MQEIMKDGILSREFFSGAEEKVKAEMDARLNDALKEDRQLKPLTVKREKIGRNDPCPCRSGKKFKKCCIDKVKPC